MQRIQCNLEFTGTILGLSSKRSLPLFKASGLTQKKNHKSPKIRNTNKTSTALGFLKQSISVPEDRPAKSDKELYRLIAIKLATHPHSGKPQSAARAINVSHKCTPTYCISDFKKKSLLMESLLFPTREFYSLGRLLLFSESLHESFPPHTA